MHADLVNKANILNHQYESVYTRDDEGDIPCLDGQPYPSMPDITSTKNVIFLNLTFPRYFHLCEVIVLIILKRGFPRTNEKLSV